MLRSACFSVAGADMSEPIVSIVQPQSNKTQPEQPGFEITTRKLLKHLAGPQGDSNPDMQIQSQSAYPARILISYIGSAICGPLEIWCAAECAMHHFLGALLMVIHDMA